MIDKVRIVYKGDTLLGMVYMVNGAVWLALSIITFVFTHRLGYLYLSVGLLLFGLYSLAKGLFLRRVAKHRHEFYEKKEENEIDWNDEYNYTSFRLNKKSANRRRYAWGVAISTMMALIGLLTNEKGLVIGTMIPVALLTAMEFSIGLLVEFRLWEYFRQLSKYLGRAFDE